MKKNLSLFFLIFTIGFSEMSKAEPVMIVSDVQCIRWAEGRKGKGSKEVESHLIGLLDGLSAGRQIPFWNFKEGISFQQVYLWMDKYCSENPDSSAYLGANELIDEQTQGLFKKNKPQSIAN
jgi:hypothetical protein